MLYYFYTKQMGKIISMRTNCFDKKKLRNAENCVVYLSFLCAFVTILHLRGSLSVLLVLTALVYDVM